VNIQWRLRSHCADIARRNDEEIYIGSAQIPSSCFTKVGMTGLGRVFRRLRLAFADPAAGIAPDAKGARVGVVMTFLKGSAELDRQHEHLFVVRVELQNVQLGGEVGLLKRRLAGAQGNHVVVDARVDENDALARVLTARRRFVEPVHAAVLDVDAADLDAERLRQDAISMAPPQLSGCWIQRQ